MKLIFFTLFTLALITAANANPFCDEDWETKTYNNLGDFTEIYLEGGYKVFLSQGEKNSVKVKTDDDDVFEYLQVRNEGGELKIDIERDHFNFDRIVLYITFIQIDKLKIEGGVKLETKGYLDLNDFEMYVAGGAKIELDIKAENVKIIGEGGVYFELEGVAKSLDIHVTGAGHVDAEELKTKDVEIKIEGVGTGTVYATETLDARIEGVGRIKYLGNPKVTKCIEGLGSISKN
jgi:hypothetical protein